MMQVKFLIALGGLAIATSAIAQDAAPAAVSAGDADKKSCRTYQATGSIMPGKRVCHTKSEWLAIDQENSNSAENARGRMNARMPASR